MAENPEVQDKSRILARLDITWWWLLLPFNGRAGISNQVAWLPVHSLLFFNLTSSFHFKLIYLLQHTLKKKFYMFILIQINKFF